MSQTAGTERAKSLLDIRLLAVPISDVEGLPAADQLRALCRLAHQRVLELTSKPLSGHDQTCLLNFVESVALTLLKKPLQAGFRDETGTSKARRTFYGELLTLVLANNGKWPLDITGFVNDANKPTPLASALVDTVVLWRMLTEFLDGLAFLSLRKRTPLTLAFSHDEKTASHLDYGPIGDPLIQPQREEFLPNVRDWIGSWDKQGLHAKVWQSLEHENDVDLFLVLAFAHRARQEAHKRNRETEHVIDTLRNTRGALVQLHTEAGRKLTFRQAEQFLIETSASWAREFDRLWKRVQQDYFCPDIEPIPAFLEVMEHGQKKILLMPAATDELTQMLLFQQGRLRKGLESKLAKSTTGRFVGAASRELARFQAMTLWPGFPANGNFWKSDNYVVGIEEKKRVLGVPLAGTGNPGDLDLYVFDRMRKTIVVGEVKLTRPVLVLGDFSGEYDEFGRKGEHRQQLARKLRWVKQHRGQFETPWGESCASWSVEGAVFTNIFPESVWGMHHDLPGIAPVGSVKARQLLVG